MPEKRRKSVVALLRVPRGAALNEKAVVIVLALMIIVPAISLLGPLLAEKFAFVNELLGGTSRPAPVARSRSGVSSDTLLYVVGFASVFFVFFTVFVAPLLFPRARRTRQEIINSLAEKFPFLEPLADPEHGHEAGMAELRGMADELRTQNQRAAEGALLIASPDLADVASPNEETAARDALKLPGLDLYDSGSSRPATTPSPTPGPAGFDYSDDEATLDTDLPPFGAPQPVIQAPSMVSPRPAPRPAPSAFNVPSLEPLVPSDDEPTINARGGSSDDPSLLTSVPISMLEGNQPPRPHRPTSADADFHEDATVNRESLAATLQSRRQQPSAPGNPHAPFGRDD